MVVLVLLTLVKATYWVLIDDQKGWLGLVGIQMLVWALFSGALYARPETWAMIGLILGWRPGTLMPHDRRQGLRPSAYYKRTVPGFQRRLSRPEDEY